MSDLIIAQDTEYFTNSGIITRHPAICAGFLLGTDSTNDPTVGAASPDGLRLILPTSTYDASALNLNGYQGQWRHCKDGISLTVTCAGTVYVVPLWQSWMSELPRDYR